MKVNIWNLFNSIIALVALIVAVFASWYTRKQVVLINEERARRDSERTEVFKWSARATDVQQYLMKFILKIGNGFNGSSSGPIYPHVINDGSLRALIETHLVMVDIGHNLLAAHQLTPEVLSLPVVRDTIKRVEKRFAEVRRDSPQLARSAFLLE
jgi:hypothetical protein